MILLKLYHFAQRIYFYTLVKFNNFREIFVNDIIDYKNIPIIINNRNRLSFLDKLITSLESKGYKNIFIIDNNSELKELLDYYEKCPYKVFRLTDNLGHLALWKSKIYNRFSSNFYIYTDSDIEIVEECPDNFVELFLQVMKNDTTIQKIGLSLRFDDLPDFYNKKNEVIEWEKQFYKKMYNDLFYIAHVDTTFAVYRPFARGGSHKFKLTLRSSYPFSARHLPWYNDSENLSAEELFYVNNSVTSTFWTNKK